jgi:O-antigen/teichoic acid export membrane protein
VQRHAHVATKDNLRTRIIRAGGWTILAYGFTQATRLLSSLVLTRLLAPEVFGIMSIVMVAYVALTLFSDIGLTQSVVRSKRGDERNYLDTLWVIQIARGIAIWAVSLLCALGLAGAQQVGWFYGDTVYAQPILPYAIAAIGFTAVLAGFESTQVAVARRNLQLGPISRLEIVGNLFAVATTILWAIIDRSIWALIGGWLMGAAFRTVSTHLYLPGPLNRPYWDRAAFEEIIGFGKWVLASSALTFLVTSGDRLILGGLLSSQELGIYSIAYLIVAAVQQGLSRLAAFVVFPSLSTILRDTPDRLRTSYYRLRMPLDLACLGFAGFFLAGGNAVIGLLYDARYEAAGGMLAILGLVLVGSRYEIAEQAFLAMGKPRLLATINATRAFTLFLVVPFAYQFGGLSGAIGGIALASLLPTLLTLYYCQRNGILDLRRELVHLFGFPVGYLAGAGFDMSLRMLHQ